MLLPEPLCCKLATTDKTFGTITQMSLELIETVGEGLIFETTFPHVEERIKAWAQYMKVYQEVREKTGLKLKSDITSLSENMQHI